nr:hypothetical protein [Nitrosomonas nitrosa]
MMNHKNFCLNMFLIVSFHFVAFVQNVKAENGYGSLVSAIDSANFQASANLSKGLWRTEIDNSQIFWKLNTGNRMNISFEYTDGIIKEGVIDFHSPIDLLVRSMINNDCAEFRISKIALSGGGQISSGRSKIDPIFDNCSDHSDDISPTLALENHFAFPSDNSLIFKGQIIGSFNTAEKCDENYICNKQHPITTVKFYKKFVDDKPMDAIKVTLRDNAILHFPNGGYVITDQNAKANIKSLYYNVLKNTGSAEIDELSVGVKAGELKSGKTNFVLGNKSFLRLSGLKMSNNGADIITDGGVIQGGLTSGTTIDLGGQSQLWIDEADVNLFGLRMSGSGENLSIQLDGGSLSLKTRAADIWFGNQNYLKLGTSELKLFLGCYEGSKDDECRPVSWGDGGSFIQGRLQPFNVTVAGGRLNLQDGAEIELKEGNLNAEILYIDSKDPVMPITGKFIQVGLVGTSKNFSIEKGVSLTSATVTLASSEMTFTADDKYPSGKLTISGGMEGFTKSNDGDTVLLKDGHFDFPLNRDPSGSLRISGGQLLGNLTASSADHKQAVDVKLKIEEIVSDNQQLGAKVSVGLIAYLPILFYGNSFPEKCIRNTLAGNIKLNGSIQDITIQATLSPLLIDNLKITKKQDVIIIDERKDIPIHISLNFPQISSFVKGEISTRFFGCDPGGSVGICEPTVDLHAQNRVMVGKLDFLWKDNTFHTSLHDLKMDSEISLTTDKDGCDQKFALWCGSIWGIVTGGIGAVAGAALCGKQVHDYNLDAEIHKNIQNQIEKLKFTSKR